MNRPLTRRDVDRLVPYATDEQIQSKRLSDYAAAVRHMELTEAAINILERLNGKTYEKCVASLKRQQQHNLTWLEGGAEALGAPYPKR